MDTHKFFPDPKGSISKAIAPREKRRHVRFPVHLAVQYGVEAPVEYTSFILNMSMGGVFIQTDQPLSVGTKILIHIYIPPDVKLLGEFTGEVAWVNDRNPRIHKGMGVKFSDVGKESLRQLEAYLNEKKHLLDKMI
ncbi:MAG: PilZ domain-containing protein [Deltaproteobacteria bacterium]|nr:PilZ domain-containing protein [Deltaproteobacteria bacterium]